MLPFDNDHVIDLHQDAVFSKMFVDQVKNGRSSVFGEICKETK